MNNIHRAQKNGQSIWLDSISRDMIRSGKLRKFVDLGVTGVTSNPTIFDKAIAESDIYDNALVEYASDGADPKTVFERLAVADIRDAADVLQPVYEKAEKRDGFVSIEVSPTLAHDTPGTVSEARRLWDTIDRPNVMIKVPGTPEGVPAIRALTSEGINVNVTLTFSLNAYKDVRQAYMAGLEDLDWSGGDVSRIASVASFFVSRVDTVIDTFLDERLREGDEDVQDLLGKTAIANAKLAYRDFKDDFEGERFAVLRSKGARVQRPLWASTSTKNSDYSDVLYPEALAGPDTVDTMPDATIFAFLDHGKAEVALDKAVEAAEAVMETLEATGVSMEQVTSKLLADGVESFSNSFDALITNVERKRSQLMSKG